MGIWSTLFNSSDAVDKATDAIINTGDKLFYTQEEKADDRKKQREFFPYLLKAYEPFKISQRIIAIWFSMLFGVSFIVGLSITIFNVIIVYNQSINGILKKDIVKVPIEPLFNLVESFSLGIIMATIVGFYFMGGTLESYGKGKK